jgi:hypothetical protein
MARRLNAFERVLLDDPFEPRGPPPDHLIEASLPALTLISPSQFERGRQLNFNDLYVITSAPAAEILYSIYPEHEVGALGLVDRRPEIYGTTRYYVSLIIPLDAELGPHRVHWQIRHVPGASVQNVAQSFTIIE